jgi:hypothetical protein
MSNAETSVMREILCAISALPGALFWRRNVGVFRQLKGAGIVRAGIPGQADLAGIYRGRAIEVEVKTVRGGLSEDQRRWKMAVEKAGGLFIVARTPADVLDTLAALDAQSGERPSTHGLASVNGVAMP